MLALDCTFRDGGYYTNWEFDLKLANRYLKAIEKAGVHAVEIGFRSPPKKIVGQFAKVTDEFIEDNLYIPNILHFGVMVDTKSMNLELIKQLFRYKDKSSINFVRAATHFKDIDLAEPILKEIKNLGYTTTIQLMQAAARSFDELARAAEKIQNWNVVDVLYIADSFGGMGHDAINYAYKAIWSGWSGLTGFHGHNNKGQALTNSLEAVDVGVNWVDGTILGMGRGPGNTETEYLLTELNKRNFEFELGPIYELVLNEFFALKRKYNWGPSLPYYLAADLNIHPTFIQELLNYPTAHVLKSIFYLKDKKTTSFNKELLLEAINA